MSLINQMLRDLQDQRKNGPPQKQRPLQTKKMDRIPYLPLPVVLGGAGVVLLCLIWWLAGALSELMFDFEPSTGHQNQQVIKEVEAPVPESDKAVVVIPDQLTPEERMAEPPPDVQAQLSRDALPAPVTTAAKLKQEPVKVDTKVVEKTTPVKSTVTGKSAVKPIVRKRAELAVKTPAKASPVRKRPSQEAPVAAKTPARVHPDDLPGAVRSVRPAEAEPLILLGRPTRGEATTPYGMAEEAYLDGLWALEQQRNNLAARSLQHALEIYPGHLKAREVLAEIYASTSKTGEALLLLTEGLEIAPDYVAFKKRYARLMIKQGDYDAATKVMLQNGLPGVKEDPEAHTILASLYQKLGESFLAAQTYRNLLVAWPKTGAFWVGLGSALEGQNLRDDAVDCYQRALKTANLREDLSLFAKRRLSQLK